MHIVGWQFFIWEKLGGNSSYGKSCGDNSSYGAPGKTILHMRLSEPIFQKLPTLKSTKYIKIYKKVLSSYTEIVVLLRK